MRNIEFSDGKIRSVGETIQLADEQIKIRMRTINLSDGENRSTRDTIQSAAA